MKIWLKINIGTPITNAKAAATKVNALRMSDEPARQHSERHQQERAEQRPERRRGWNIHLPEGLRLKQAYNRDYKLASDRQTQIADDNRESRAANDEPFAVEPGERI